jgi:hypothetical protein
LAGKKCPVTDAKEVEQGMFAEETFRHRTLSRHFSHEPPRAANLALAFFGTFLRAGNLSALDFRSIVKQFNFND